MAKIYDSKKKTPKTEQMKPKKETIQFLLDYSKALSVKGNGKMTFETLLN